MEKPKRPRGRPAGTGKPEEAKWRGWQVRFPPEELEEFKRQVPEGERAEFVRQAIRRALEERRGTG
jgi:hypothetical protein